MKVMKVKVMCVQVLEDEQLQRFAWKQHLIC